MEKYLDDDVLFRLLNKTWQTGIDFKSEKVFLKAGFICCIKDHNHHTDHLQETVHTWNKCCNNIASIC